MVNQTTTICNLYRIKPSIQPNMKRVKKKQENINCTMHNAHSNKLLSLDGAYILYMSQLEYTQCRLTYLPSYCMKLWKQQKKNITLHHFRGKKLKQSKSETFEAATSKKYGYECPHHHAKCVNGQNSRS